MGREKPLIVIVRISRRKERFTPDGEPGKKFVKAFDPLYGGVFLVQSGAILSVQSG